MCSMDLPIRNDWYIEEKKYKEMKRESVGSFWRKGGCVHETGRVLKKGRYKERTKKERKET